jgi:hypothetical protein
MTQPHNHKPEVSEGVMMPKTDEKGRIYREVRCANCRAFICDEYIREGRIRFKCFRCGRIMVMEFRPRRSKRKPGAPANTKLKEETHE